MADDIPYRRELTFTYGAVDRLSPLVRRVVAHNPGPFTFHGTGTYIVGNGEVAVIDPGPALPEHIDALLAATAGETITHVFVTHTHMDHSPGCALLKDHCDAPTYAYGPHGAGKEAEGVVVEEGGDMDFAPDITLRHGDLVEGGDWTIEAVYTPGHTSNHLCFGLPEEQLLFTGDHVMGWSTSVISPPDGDMAAYMASLELLLGRDDRRYWPTHGPSIEQPHRHVRAFIAHRRAREAQIIKAVRDGTQTITAMVPGMYAGLPEAMYPAAARSVLAAAEYLVARGELACDGAPRLDAVYRLP